jgi:large repetitive protein
MRGQIMLGVRARFHRILSFVAVASLAGNIAGCGPLEGILSPLSPNEDGDAAPKVIPQKGDIILIGGATAINVNPMTGTDLPALKTAEVYRPATGTFALTGALATQRAGIQAIAFTSGALADRILVAGGAKGTAHFNATNGVVTLSGSAQKTADLFNANTGLFAAGGTMVQTRDLATATLLSNGKVLVTGGFFGTTPRNTAELYNPATKTFTLVPDTMTSPRALHTATLLANGQVLIAGGISNADGTVSTTADLYNPNTNRFIPIAAPLPTEMASHTATRIAGCNCPADGKIFLAGGFDGTGANPSLETAGKPTALYDPASKTFTPGPLLTDARAFHTATLLPGGRILFAGGVNGQTQFGAGQIIAFSGGVTRNSAEIYASKTGALTCVKGAVGGACRKSMILSRTMHSATVIPSGADKGKVLFAGGNLDRRAELFDPAAGTFAATGEMKTRRIFHAAAVVP